MACLSGQSNDFSHKFALVCRRSSSMFGKKKKRKNINTKACPCDRIFRGAIFLPAFMHYSVELSSGGGNWVDRRCRINKWTAVRSKWNVVHRGDKWCGEWSRIFRVLPLLHFGDTADDKERKGGECVFSRAITILRVDLMLFGRFIESLNWRWNSKLRNIGLDSKIRGLFRSLKPKFEFLPLKNFEIWCPNVLQIFLWNYDHRYSILNEKNIVDIGNLIRNWQHII